MNTREQLIHGEMQSLRTVGFKILQAGVGLLVIIELFLAFIRRRGIESMVTAKQLIERPFLPFAQHLLGTILLLVVATIFSVMAMTVSRRFRFYSNLLRNDGESTVPIPVDVAGAGYLIVLTYAVFPLIDLLMWPYLRIVWEGH